MGLPEEIHSHLSDVYAAPSLAKSKDGSESEVHTLVATVQDCLRNLVGDVQGDYLEKKQSLERVRAASHALMATSPSKDSFTLRQIYTDSCIILCLLDLIYDEKECGGAVWVGCIHLLDAAIVFSGAPERMDIVQRLIRYIQTEKLASLSETAQEDTGVPAPPGVRDRVILPPCGGTVPRIGEPDMVSFLTTWCNVPFVISGGIAHWPALSIHPWASQQYLKNIAGGGRIVPVEIGKDYRLDNWGQEMMDWGQFLEKVETTDEPLIYLAQHSLLSQFPELRDDISVPDFVYLSPTTGHEEYAPPTNEDGVIINAWLGPKGTLSPAHQDPYFNCYAQVVGEKTVWLAPPHFGHEMYPLPSDSGLSNTTSLDVFSTITEESYPLFVSKVLNASIAITLNPGDLLFLPPGWWHAMRSEEKSFSVSFWF